MERRLDTAPVMRRYLTEAEQAQLLAHVDRLASPLARRDAAWMRALLLTGCRIGEFSQLTVGQALDAVSRGYLFIPREHRKGRRADHQVFCTEACRTAIKAMLAARAEITGEPHPPREARLLASRQGEGLTVRLLQTRLRHWAREAGLAVAASPHWLRHTRAMNIMRRSTSHDPRGIVQAQLGHASIATTGIYTGISREELEAGMQGVDGARRPSKAAARRAWDREHGGVPA